MITVLVADDDPSVLAATRFALAGCRVEGHEVAVVGEASAEAAYHRLRAGGIGVVLIDIEMETATAGLGLVERILTDRSVGPVGLVVRTGRPELVAEAPLRERGVHDYLLKANLSRARLVEAIETAHRAAFTTVQPAG